jgi:hypothetical protein
LGTRRDDRQALASRTPSNQSERLMFSICDPADRSPNAGVPREG